MSTSKKNTWQEKLVLLHSSTSAKEFIREYKRLWCGKSNGTDLYILLLTKLKRAISEGNYDNLKKLSDLIDYTNDDVKDLATLRDYYDDSNNPIRNTNLVILASQHNKLSILQYLLDGHSKVLHNLSIGIGKTAILPEDEDDVSHNAFYYAIRSGNTQLLDILIRKWPGNYFSASSEELEVVLSRAYDELRLKNVPLSEEMEGFVENELINLRFFSNASEQDPSPWGDINKTRERIALVLELVGFLTTNYSNTEEVNGRFIFVAKFIAQNIHILKQRLKSTYNRLPWEEMEFCLAIFISSRTKLQELNLFYRAILNKTKILKYLRNFANELGGENDITRGDKLNCLPRGQKRENVVAKIIGTHPQFAELYYDYDQIRDIYSLEKISDNIKLALLADPQEKEGQLIITRVLQVIGENMKNTLQSPNLSHTASELLFISLPKDTRKIIIDLRDAISHADALSTRIQIEEKADSFFINVQNDIKKLGNVINGILYKNKIKTIRILLTKIVNSANLDEMKEVLQELSADDLDKLVNTTTGNFKTMEQEKLEKLIKKLSDNITDKTDYENELFNKIYTIINCAGTESGIIRSDYIVGFENLRMFSQAFSDNNNVPNLIRVIKLDAKIILQNIVPKIKQGHLNEIGQLIRNIFHSVKSRVRHKKLDEIKSLTWEIIYSVEFGRDSINWIEELREQLGKQDSRSRTCQLRKIYNLTGDKKIKNLLALKLSELKTVFSNNSCGSLVNLALGFYKNDQKIVAAVEMLVLDIVEILGSLRNGLENTLLFLDDNTPLLNGTCLRNYLAHDNGIVDVILSDPSRAVFLNAKKLTEENIITNERRIGKLVRDDPVKLREKYHQSLITITNQERMFVALEDGDLESLQDCLLKGADLKARSVGLWTTLHFAAKGSCLEVVKFILDHNLNPNVKDNDGQTPLHVAAAYGREEIVDFFVTEAGLCVDELTKHEMVPLHFAAKNGHKDTVQILLKNKANTSTHDTRGFLPLHYAIMNNHISVVKSLLEKEVNVDIIETIGGSTPLHVAAQRGHLELVNFFLERGSYVNATTDENATPLHSAAGNGHVKVVKALILNGANVNTGVMNYLTPLHCAVSWGSLEVINILLNHEAYVNAGISTVESITPLHLAIQRGHLEIVTVLIKRGADISAQSRQGGTPLHCAALYGHPEIAALLIKNGADINTKCYNNRTALHLAAGNGNEDVAHLLIKSKAEVNMQDIDGYTPLYAAAANGSKDMIDFLIKNRADVNSKSVDGITPLHVAVTKGHEAAVDFLIQNKAVVNAKNNSGLTPLHLAVLDNQKDIVNLLIENKAQVFEKGFSNLTPIRIAAQAGHTEIVEILVAQGADVEDKSYVLTPLLDAIKCNHKEIVEMLLANGANVSSGDIEAWSIPLLAGYNDIVEILLKNPEYVNYKNVDHATPLHFAAKGGQKRIAKTLIDKGADIDAVTINNITPVFVAAKEGYDEVLKVLLAYGANVNIKSKENVTPLHIAAIEGHSKVVKVLLDYKQDINLTNGNIETSKQGIEPSEIIMHLPKEVSIVACKGDIHTLQNLLDDGVDANDKDIDGRTLLHYAVYNGHIDIVNMLLKYGADVTQASNKGNTPLHTATSKGYNEILEVLLQHISHNKLSDVIDAKTTASGVTALHIAAKNGYLDITKSLLKRGAIYDIKNNQGKTPLDLSTDQNVINFLNIVEELFEDAEIGNVEVIDKVRLLKTDDEFLAATHARNNQQQTLLQVVTVNSHTELASKLLEELKLQTKL